MYKVFFITFGCKVNYYETECMKSLFRESGFEIGTELSSADAVMHNPCMFFAIQDRPVSHTQETRHPVDQLRGVLYH